MIFYVETERVRSFNPCVVRLRLLVSLEGQRISASAKPEQRIRPKQCTLQAPHLKEFFRGLVFATMSDANGLVRFLEGTRPGILVSIRILRGQEVFSRRTTFGFHGKSLDVKRRTFGHHFSQQDRFFALRQA